MREILGARWFTNVDGLIGIVAARTSAHAPELGEWKAYIGMGQGISQEADQQHIANLGSALQSDEAAAFFPHLDITKYKEYQAPAEALPAEYASKPSKMSEHDIYLSNLARQQRDRLTVPAEGEGWHE